MIVLGDKKYNKNTSEEELSRIGILYDSGSASQNKHSKISYLSDRDFWKTLFKKKEVKKYPKKLSSKIPEIIEEDFLEDPLFILNESLSSGSEISLGQSQSNDAVSFIRQTIEESKLKHLFLFVSHPDKDHISFIDKVLPLNLPVTAILGGNWFSKQSDKELSRLVSKILNFLKNREKTWIELPFFWGGLKSLSSTYTYEIFKSIFNDDDKDYKNTLEFVNKTKIIPGANQLDLFHLLDRMNTLNGQNSHDLIKHLRGEHPEKPILDISFDTNSYYQYCCNNDAEILKRINVFNIQYPFQDINSQSTIVEIKSPSLGIQFFLTGDATEETFALVNEYQFFKKDSSFLSFVVFPHHGSENNQSLTMLDMLHPDVGLFSSGNGALWRHPSKKLLHETIKLFKEEDIGTKFYDSFDLFGEKQNHLIYFDKDEDKNIPYVFRNKKNPKEIPFFCTNLLGHIKIDKEGVKSYFSSILSDDKGHIFRINYKKRLEDLETTKLFNEKFQIKSGIIKYNNEYYLRILSKNDGLSSYYFLEEINHSLDKESLISEGYIDVISGNLNGEQINLILSDILNQDTKAKLARLLELRGNAVNKSELEEINGIGLKKSEKILEKLNKLTMD
ncbi:hypothetical protein [Cysteiniphilum litorale]|uniref:hypothetical protein n=1 Tax=Cysteiniphilum litorale TaxID=2056700 RepID=UPI003F881A7F